MKFPYKGIFAFCSAVCLFAVSMPISTVAASAETSSRKTVQADCVSDFADADSEDGYLPLQGAASSFENSDGEQPLYGSAAETDTVPESYDLREQGVITSVKDQGSDGMCWAFATLGAAESHLLKYYETDLDNINDMDLSEEQVGYFLYRPTRSHSAQLMAMPLFRQKREHPAETPCMHRFFSALSAFRKKPICPIRAVLVFIRNISGNRLPIE